MNQQTIPRLRLAGHFGEIFQPKNAPPRSMFIPDANVVLTLLRHANTPAALPKPYRDLLLTTRFRVRRYWHEREREILVNPTIASLELSKQDRARDYEKFLSYQRDFYRRIYLIDNVDPSWIEGCYDSAIRLMDSTFRGMEQTVSAALQRMPAETADESTVLKAVDEFCGWLEQNVDSLATVGGPSLFVPVLAMAGSGEARRILKVTRISRDGIEDIARNVAWDFMYFAHREISYFARRYDNDIFCTADDALATLLLMKTNLGPRFAPASFDVMTDVPAFGDFRPFPCARLDANPQLSHAIEHRVSAMWHKVGQFPDTLRVGFDHLISPQRN